MAKEDLLRQALVTDRALVFKRYGARPSYSLVERTFRYTFRTLAYLTVAVTLAIVLVLFVDSLQFFGRIHILDFFFGTEWEPFGENKKLGILPLLSGTLMIALGGSAVAAPLGLGTAIFLTQYAPRRVYAIVSPVVELLGGVPSVVYGYFALVTVTPFLREIFPTMEVFNALSASIAVGVAVIPTISSISSDALRAVPSSIRLAGYAVGMRKIHVILKVVVPAAMSGIFASFMLGFARAAGETMIVTLAAGSTPNMNFDYMASVQTMTAFIVQISMGDTPAGSLEYYTIYAVGLSLFLVTFAFNFAASRIVRRYREVYK